MLNTLYNYSSGVSASTGGWRHQWYYLTEAFLDYTTDTLRRQNKKVVNEKNAEC